MFIVTITPLIRYNPIRQINIMPYKKRNLMPKTLFIIMTIITFIPQTYAMNREITLFQSHSQPCRFEILPIDAIHIICQFLIGDIETKEEFIERTQHMSDKKPFHSQFNTGKVAFSAYCPNKDKCALLSITYNKAKYLCIKEEPPFFCIIDIKRNISLYQENFFDREYKCIGLSQDGNTFATLGLENEVTGNSYDYCTATPRYKSVLAIKNIISQKTEIFDIHNYFQDPFGFNFPAIAFNKQGNLLIVHYQNSNNSSTQNNTAFKTNQYKIFKNTHTSYIDISENPFTILSKYLAYHNVCKNLTLQIAPSK